MAVARMTMTDEQRKSVAMEYLKAFDNKGVTSSGASILDLFADDAQVFFPKWGLATGKKQIGQLFTDFGGLIEHILHDYATFNWVMTGTDTFAVEGTSAGRQRDGTPRSRWDEEHASKYVKCWDLTDRRLRNDQPSQEQRSRVRRSRMGKGTLLLFFRRLLRP